VPWEGVVLLRSIGRLSERYHCQFQIISIICVGMLLPAFNESIKVGFPVELSTTNYLQIGCHMNTLFRRQVVSYLGSGVLFSTKGPSECILTYAHLKWT
jgi:hypothetical protein